MTSFLVIKLKSKSKTIKMMVKALKINKKIINLMTKTLIKATKTFNSNPKKITATNLSEITQLKKILEKAKRKKMNSLP